MTTEYTEKDWRCPQGGAFHVLNMSQTTLSDTPPSPTHFCVNCRQSVAKELLDAGMANMANMSEATKPPKPILAAIADVDAFNAALRRWLLDTCENHIGDTYCSAEVVSTRLGARITEINSRKAGERVPRVPDGLTEEQAMRWCQDFITNKLSYTEIRYLVRTYPHIQHHVTQDDPDWGTTADEFYGFRFRIYVV